MDSGQTFATGETVFCFSNLIMYKAKCVMAASVKGQMKYFVHYVGWNKRYDEWVLQCRLLKYNAENVKTYKDAQDTERKQNSKPKKTKGRRERRSRTTDDARNEDESQEVVSEETVAASTIAEVSSTTTSYIDRIEILAENDLNRKWNVELPDMIKKIIVYDWVFQTEHEQMQVLPAKPCVDEILQSYQQYKSDQTNCVFKQSAINEVMQTFSDHFNCQLGNRLIYEFENEQYVEVLNQYPDMPPSQIYGVTHFMRLLVIIGPLFANSLPEKEIHEMLAHTYDIMDYLVENRSTLFSFQQYVPKK